MLLYLTTLPINILLGTIIAVYIICRWRYLENYIVLFENLSEELASPNAQWCWLLKSQSDHAQKSNELIFNDRQSKTLILWIWLNRLVINNYENEFKIRVVLTRLFLVFATLGSSSPNERI